MRAYSLLILSFLLLASAVLINSAKLSMSEESLLSPVMEGRLTPPEGTCVRQGGGCSVMNVFAESCCGMTKCKCDYGFAGNCKCYASTKG
uniref:U32-Hexatoxin-Hc1a_2 n=1 Tax=Hadronyche cerberea TaxID=1107879 RepID=A0A4Q8KBH8_HADCE